MTGSCSQRRRLHDDPRRRLQDDPRRRLQDDPRRRLQDDRGVVATAIVLFPAFAAVVFMFVQGAFWQLDVQVARAAADKASEAAAMYGHSSGEAEAIARDQMASAGIRNISVSVAKGDDITVVEVSGTAPGLLPGMSIAVSAHSVTPTETFRQ